jgi:hypothetical protein
MGTDYSLLVSSGGWGYSDISDSLFGRGMAILP